MTQTDELVEKLKSRADGWRAAATTKEIRDKVLLYDEAAAEIERLRGHASDMEKAAAGMSADVTHFGNRLEAAENTLKRVRELPEKWAGKSALYVEPIEDLRTALDGDSDE